MKNLLSRANTEILAQVAWSRVLLAFDFDGTLAPITGDRSRAQMRPKTAELFTKLCRLFPCAVISGRSQSDVAARLGRARVKYVMGNHGLEPGADLGAFERDIARVRERLERTFRGWPGLEIEDKQFSLALHYRKSRQANLTRDAIHEAVANLPDRMRIVAGKRVVNVLPQRAPNKGQALIHVRTAEGADTAFYVGDDLADEDVFSLDQPGRLLAVRVGKAASTSAAYYVSDQKAIDSLLAKLVMLGQQRKAS
jgi:trehalose 6-phosphate phosphatase